MKKIILIVSMLLGIVLTASACGSNAASKSAFNSDGKVKVVVSFNAMKEFTEAVGKDKVDIYCMTPDGTEPHDFEPKVQDLKSLSDGKVFIYNGFGMESWVDKTLETVDNKELLVVDASKGSEPIKNTDTNIINDDGQYDPHIWISLKGAENEANNIKDALVKVDPSDKSYFEKNYSDFRDQLEQLYSEYSTKFSTIKNKNFVTGHAAFAYLCRDFGLNQSSVEDVFADGEPSAKKLKELIDYCKQNKIKTIFVEDMVSPKVSETLANEVGAKAEKIYTIESKVDNKDYIECMKENLKEIYDSLK